MKLQLIRLLVVIPFTPMTLSCAADLPARTMAPTGTRPPSPVQDTAESLDESLVAIRHDRLDLREQIQFVADSEAIEPHSFPLLDQIAAALVREDNIIKVRVIGETDGQGDDEGRLILGGRRAFAVASALRSRGLSCELDVLARHTPKRSCTDGSPQCPETRREIEFLIEREDNQTPTPFVGRR